MLVNFFQIDKNFYKSLDIQKGWNFWRLFFDLEESWELEESESLELSSLPEEEDEDELELELPDEELPEVAEDDALLEPARLGGILDPKSA